MRNLRYDISNCGRDLTSAGSFSSGTQEFRFVVPQGSYAELAKSFLRYENTTLTVAGTFPKVSDGIGFAIDPVACAYDKLELRCMDQPICKIGEGNWAVQDDVLRKRRNVNKTRRDAILNYTENFNCSLDERINRVSRDGVKTSGKLVQSAFTALKDSAGVSFISSNGLSLSATGLITFGGTIPNCQEVFLAGDIINLVTAAGVLQKYVVAGTPSIGSIQLRDQSSSYTVFSTPAIGAMTVIPYVERHERSARVNSQDFQLEFGYMLDSVLLPPGNYSFMLYPKAGSSYKIAMVESKTPMNVGTGAGQFDVSIANVRLHLALFDAEVKDEAHEIMFESYNFRQLDLPSNTNQQQLRFDVPRNTRGITVFSQSALVGSNDTTYSPARLVLPKNGEKFMTQLNIEYKALNSNVPQMTPQYVLSANPNTTGTDTRLEMYRKCLQNTGQYWSDAPESYEEWGGSNQYAGLDSFEGSGFGEYYYHPFLASNKNEDTSAIVHVQYSVAPVSARLVVVAHTTQRVMLNVKDGKVNALEVVNE